MTISNPVFYIIGLILLAHGGAMMWWAAALSTQMKNLVTSIGEMKEVLATHHNIIMHKDDIKDVIKFYEKNGKEIILSKKLGLVAYEGHIVGCQYAGLKAIQDEVDCFLILGNQFHSMGATLAVEKPVILLDVYNDDVRSMDGLREKILKQRIISVEKLKEAKKVGIIIDIKPGQKFGTPEYLLNKLKEAGKEVTMITMSELTPDKLMNFYYIDAFIELACPRIAIDDFAKYPKPILTFKEALVALGEKSWEEFLKNGVI